MSLVGAWRSVAVFFSTLLFVGAVGAASGWRPGAFLFIAGVGGLVAGRLVVAIAAYRRIMARPWPQVRPLDDDDGW